MNMKVTVIPIVIGALGTVTEGLVQELSSSLSSLCRATSTDIPDPLSPLLPIVHRLRQVFRATPRFLT